MFFSQAPLPPDHPPMPAGHPAIPDAQPSSALPPNHPPVREGKVAPSGEDLLRKLEAVGDLKAKEKTFEVAASLGKLYFVHGKYSHAATFLAEAVLKAEPSRALYLAKRKALGSRPVPTATAALCSTTSDATLDSRLKQAQAQSDVSVATACLQLALEPLIDIESQLGAAKFLSRDFAGALATYNHALALFEKNAEARYGRAAVLLDTQGEQVASLTLAKADLENFLADASTSPQKKQAQSFLKRINDAIAAGGVSKVKAVAKAPAADPHAGVRPNGQPPPLTQEMIDAVQNVERTNEMNQGFAKLVDQAEDHLAGGRYQEALDNYKRVVPFEPENARAKAGMAWAMVKLNKQPMADNVWRVASQNPQAIDALGETLKVKGDAAGAKALWQKLAASVPGYAEKLSGKL